MSTVYVKQHDTKGTFTDTLMVAGVPVNLTGTVVKFLMRKPNGVLISQTATIVSPGAGTVSYQPVAEDVAVVGKYRQEWEVTFPDTKILSFPNDTYNLVMIERDVSDVGGFIGPPPGGGGTIDSTLNLLRGDNTGNAVDSGIAPETVGDFKTDTTVAIVDELVLFADTTGKLGKRATGNGLAKLTAGVLGFGVEGTDFLGVARIDDAAFGAGWNGDTGHAPSRNAVYDLIASLPAAVNIGAVGFSVGKTTGLATGKTKGFVVFPVAATITAYNFVIDTGTATIKVWKVATGTSKPTAVNSINTSGVSISTGTALRSTVLTDFTTTAIAANDIFAFEITALGGSPTELMFTLELTKT